MITLNIVCCEKMDRFSQEVQQRLKRGNDRRSHFPPWSGNGHDQRARLILMLTKTSNRSRRCPTFQHTLSVWDTVGIELMRVSWTRHWHLVCTHWHWTVNGRHELNGRKATGHLNILLPAQLVLYGRRSCQLFARSSIQTHLVFTGIDNVSACKCDLVFTKYPVQRAMTHVRSNVIWARRIEF